MKLYCLKLTWPIRGQPRGQLTCPNQSPVSCPPVRNGDQIKSQPLIQSCLVNQRGRVSLKWHPHSSLNQCLLLGLQPSSAQQSTTSVFRPTFLIPLQLSTLHHLNVIYISGHWYIVALSCVETQLCPSCVLHPGVLMKLQQIITRSQVVQVKDAGIVGI